MLKLEDKKKIAAELKEQLSASQLLIFTDYRGLTVKEMSELRDQLRPVKAQYQVVKNTLTRRAMTEAGLDDLLPMTEGPNAIIFGSEDLVGPAKIVFDFAKTHKNLEVRGGALNGRLIGVEDLRSLSKLPPREVLLAQVAGTMASPMTAFATVLKANLVNLVRVLDAVREQKESA